MTKSNTAALSAVLAAALGAAALPTDAWATLVPDASYEIAASAGPSSNVAFPTLGIGSVSGTFDTVSGGVLVGTESSGATVDGAFITISGSSTGLSPVYLSTAMAISQFYYEVIGPEALIVPMLISASVSTSVFGGDPGGTDTSVTARVVYTTDTGTEQLIACSSLSAINVCFPYPTADSLIDHPFNVMSLALQEIILRADGGTNYSTSGSSYSGTADPLVTIDPTWSLEHPGYSLVFSSNIASDTPTNGVPEPQSYALVLTALALMRVLARRRTRRQDTPGARPEQSSAGLK
jgi:hypothetical protein